MLAMAHGAARPCIKYGAGSKSSFQPPGVQRHHGAAVPSALPHDRRVRNAEPGNPTRSRWLETLVAQQVAETKTSGIPATGRFVVKGILMTVILPLDLACQIVSAS